MTGGGAKRNGEYEKPFVSFPCLLANFCWRQKTEINNYSSQATKVEGEIERAIRASGVMHINHISFAIKAQICEKSKPVSMQINL